jgi:hypothetical protein
MKPFCKPLVCTVGLVLITALALAGCGGPSGPPGTIPVTGTVAHAGRPLPDGSVHFAANSGGGGGAARLANGRFRVHLVPGRYRIAVISTEGFEQVDPKTGGIMPGKSRIPGQYTTVETSGLAATIDATNDHVPLTLGP